MKIIDCFIILDEIWLLEYRLSILNSKVDFFVVVESNQTFSGKPKPFNLEKHPEILENYKNKLIYVKNNNFPATDDPWQRESFQRNCFKQGLKEIDIWPEDMILFSDIDEVPDPNFLHRVNTGNYICAGIERLKQDMYYYNLNCKAASPNTTSLITCADKITDIDNLNEIVRSNIPFTREKAGWHLSYFGNPEWIVKKIQSFSHQEYNTEEYTNKESIQNIIDKCQDLFLRDNKSKHRFYYLPLEANNYLPPNPELLNPGDVS